MARRKREADDVLGESSLTEPFDVCIIGSGAGGGSAAHVLTAAKSADLPFTYDDLEPFYVEAERLYGTQGNADSIYESRRSQPYPTPAGLGMYMNLLIADAAKAVSVPDIGALNPHTYPAAI